ncbi:MAG: molybdopterin converting factor subunit 1 [Methermicoccaceae archaeon]
MMRITVYYFAQLRELVGMEREVVELEKGASLEALKKHLLRLHPEIATLSPHMMFAVDKRVAKSDHVLKDGDEVRAYPPVSGG